MLKNRSISLQKINPVKHAPSRVQNHKNQRLIFPQVGDSGLYGGVGRKHYDNTIKQLILNYGYEGGLIKPSVNPENIRLSYEKNKNLPLTKNESNNSPQYDSLTKLQAQFDQKKIVRKDKDRGSDDGLYSQKIHRKNVIQTPRKSQSHLRLFGSVGDIYGMVNGKQKLNTIDYSPRAFNPTNLSSKFKAV